jgi:membrane protein insertase Oxa1/YidC/SpoIIIJ
MEITSALENRLRSKENNSTEHNIMQIFHMIITSFFFKVTSALVIGYVITNIYNTCSHTLGF